MSKIESHDNFETIKNKILEILNEDPQNEEYIISQLKLIHSGDVMSGLFRVLTNLEFSEDEAKEHWNNILKHRDDMEKKLNRSIGFRVASLDYLVNINKVIQNPKIIEIHAFEATAKLALLDELTLLFNRRYFNSSVEKEYKRSVRHKVPFSIFFFDVDDFKKVNDTYGHRVGDDVLRQIGQIVLQLCRKEDIACRYGGEEFAMILPATNKEGAFSLANRIRNAIKIIKLNNELRISISGGIACFPDDAENTQDIINYADKAMYRGKFTGKDAVIIYNKSF